MKLVFLDRGTVQGGGDDQLDYTQLEALGQLTSYDVSPQDSIVANIADNNIVIVNATALVREVLEQCPAVELIAKFGTGVDRIDLEAAQDLGIGVINVPSYGSRAVAQWTVTLLFNAISSFASFQQCVKNGRWSQDRFRYPIRELDGMTVGILGIGSIGREFAGMLQGFNVTLIAHTPNPKPDVNVEYVSLHELAERSDIVSIHCAANESTCGIIDTNFLKLMKHDAYLINTARAAIVDEGALVQALENREIAGAAFDVFWQEPAPAAHPLLKLDNFLLTPHVAWCSRTTRQHLTDSLAKRISAFYDGDSSLLLNAPAQRPINKT